MPAASNFLFSSNPFIIFSYSISLLVTNFLGISIKSLIYLFYFFTNLIKLKPPSRSHQTVNPIHQLRYLVCARQRESGRAAAFPIGDYCSSCTLVFTISCWASIAIVIAGTIAVKAKLRAKLLKTTGGFYFYLLLFLSTNSPELFVFILERYNLKGNSTLFFFFLSQGVICLFWALLFYVWIYWGHSLKLHCIIPLLNFQKQTSTIVQFP